MLGNIPIWLGLLLITAGLGWLAMRAFRADGLVEWVSGSVSALLTLWATACVGLRPRMRLPGLPTVDMP